MNNTKFIFYKGHGICEVIGKDDGFLELNNVRNRGLKFKVKDEPSHVRSLVSKQDTISIREKLKTIPENFSKDNWKRREEKILKNIRTGEVEILVETYLDLEAKKQSKGKLSYMERKYHQDVYDMINDELSFVEAS